MEAFANLSLRAFRSRRKALSALRNSGSAPPSTAEHSSQGKRSQKKKFWRHRMANGWKPERKAKHSTAIRCWKPWEKASGRCQPAPRRWAPEAEGRWTLDQRDARDVWSKGSGCPHVTGRSALLCEGDNLRRGWGIFSNEIQEKNICP
jgi:hypothetical protein